MNRFKKLNFFVATMLCIVLAFFGNLFFPRPTYAVLGVGDFTTIIANIPQVIKDIYEQIEKNLGAVLINAGARAASYAMRKVAYDSAVWLASGGKGQSPLAYTGGFGNYIANVANEAGGAAIEQLSRDAGINLCKIPNIKVDLALKIGLRTKFAGAERKPICNTTDFLKNWGNGISKFASGGNIIKSFNATLKADDSDFGIYGQAVEQIDRRVYNEQAAAVLDRQEGQGFKPMTSLISGQTLLPAQLVKESATQNTPDKVVKQNQDELNAAIAKGDIRVFPSLLSIFLSTLGSNIISNYQTKGILPFLGGGANQTLGNTAYNSNALLNFEGQGISTVGRVAAKSFFAYLTAVKIPDSPKYDLIAQLDTCPDSPGIYNCRMGEDMVNALNQNLTIGEAIRKGILDGTRRLIPPTQTTKSTDINCYQDAYCLTNVQVLRQVRILPLGFEIAVRNSDSQKPWTLQQVVNGFEDCTRDGNGNVVSDPAKPFCHLVDPNWVLKAPDAKCNALVNTGILLSSDAPARLQDCVDLQTCVGYSANGTCTNYAYCTREKNTWKFAADNCDRQFATCSTYQNSNGQSVNYLTRTLDTGACTADNAGCRAYSLVKDGNGWVQPVYTEGASDNTGIFLNNKAQSTCSANSVGCSAFQVASSPGTTLYLRKAPDYLKCYDADPNTTAIDWPQTVADLSRTSGDPQCKQYSQACVANEENCSWYTPVQSGGAKIPGKFTPAVIENNQITWNDQCDARCVGYDTYQELPSTYTSGDDLAYIIPSSGQSCSASEVGCSSFTNLNGGGTEYYTYLRPCVKPSETPNGQGTTFVTYEGSKDSGFALKTFLLLTDDTGGPAYYDPNNQSLNDECNEDRYKSGLASLDCRQFNDQSGAIYYRMLSHVVVVSDKCTAYRLNNPEFDPSGGCPSGGANRDGGCVYEGLPDGVDSAAGVSQSCSAGVATCRAYKGNTGNNVQQIFNDTFEGGAPGWSAGAYVSAVSTHVGEHSLEINGTASKQLSLEFGQGYDLTFWAAGSGGNLQVSFVAADGTQSSFGSVSVGGGWRAYHLGPVEIKGQTASVALTFTGSGTVYLDNVRLVKMNDRLYLVKKTLKVDPVCDSIPDDGLPGEALGCKAYSDAQSQTVYLANFSYLCREDAIGCTALFDTHNQPNAPTSTSPVYLVASQKYSCNASDVGCTYAGAEKITSAGTQYVTTTIKNDPSTYSDTLCTREAVGCDAFSDGTKMKYFKDPNVIGQRLCTFRSNIVYNGQKVSGWFVKNSSVTSTPQPCYPDYLMEGGVFGIWSYGNTPEYQNFVGECPADQNKCTEFVDHADNDKSYFLIKDDRVNDGDCNGQVSQKNGCALFDQVDVPEKTWSTTSTYQASERQDSKLVAPVSDGINDANTIIKVVQDHECGEWLQCGQSYSVFDQQTNKYRSICQGLTRCQQGIYTDECGEGITENTYQDTALTQDIYVRRGVAWRDMDYDGYSLFNIYPLEQFAQVNFSTSSINPDWRLVMKIPCGSNCAAGSYDPSSCGAAGNAYADHQACGTASRPGLCINRVCVNDIKQASVADASPSQECRAYPEEDSPFPNSGRIRMSPAFKNANLCDEATSTACNCNYTKAIYGDNTITNYYSPRNVHLPPGICYTGTNTTTHASNVGHSCSHDADCGEGGSCQLFKNKHSFIGWKGFCIEEDNTRHLNSNETDNVCLTWYPIESLSGTADVYSQHVEAGQDWRDTPNGEFYCTSARGTVSSTPSTTLAFSAAGLWLPRDVSTGDNSCALFDNGYGAPSTVGDDDGCAGDNRCDGDCIYFFNRSHINVADTTVGFAPRIYGMPSTSIVPRELSNIKKEDIDYIELTVVDSNGSDNIQKGGTYYIFPNSFYDYDSQSYYNVRTNIGNPATAVSGFYQGDPNQVVFFYNADFSEGYVTKSTLDSNGAYFFSGTTDNCYGPNDTYAGLSGNLFSPNGLQAGSANAEIWDRTISNYYDTQRKIGYVVEGCEHSESERVTWNAVRLSFDRDSHLLTSMDTAFANGNYSNRGQRYDVTYRISFKLRRWCPMVTDALLDPGNDGSNRTIAWTDRLFGTARNQYSLPVTLPPAMQYRHDDQNPAFGSFGSIFDLTSPVIIAQQTWRNPSCANNARAGNACVFNNVERPAALGGSAYSLSPPDQNIPQGQMNLSALFASVVNNYKFVYDQNSGGGTYELAVTGDPIGPYWDITQTGDTGNAATRSAPVPPQIHQLGTCVGGNRGGASGSVCTEGGIGFTINGQNSGNVSVVSGRRVSIDFYMFADKNQMPIRRVAVNWGDGTEVTPIDGYFRNQRGATSITPQVLLACSEPETALDFGHIVDHSCDNAYFHTEHIYNCGSGNTCVFHPGVMVEDNWNWCNGACSNGCYDFSRSPQGGNDDCMSRGGTGFSGSVTVSPQPAR